MALDKLDDNTWMCGECGKTFSTPNAKCCTPTKLKDPPLLVTPSGVSVLEMKVDPETLHTIIVTDAGFGTEEIDLDQSLTDANTSLLDALSHGKMKRALGIKDEIRELVSLDSKNWTMGGDGRAVRRTIGEPESTSPDARPNSPDVSPLVNQTPTSPDTKTPASIQSPSSSGRRLPHRDNIKRGERRELRTDGKIKAGGVVMDANEVQRSISTRSTRTPRKAKSKGERDCACGCGGKTKSVFVMGHDSKVKSLLGRVGRGEVKEEDLKPNILAYYKAWQEDNTLKLSEWFAR